MDDKPQYVRIKKDVRPYGGKRVQVVARKQYPNGRKVVEVLVDRNSVAPVREYNVDEVDDLR